MSLQIIDNEDLFKSLEAEWNSLYESAAEYMPFQSFAWNHSWWTKASEYDTLHIIVHKIENKIDAIFPLYIDKTGTLRFIGDIHSDYCRFLIFTDSISKRYSIIKAFAKYIIDSDTIKTIRLENVASDDRDMALLSTMLGYKQFTYMTNGCSYIDFGTHAKKGSCFSYLSSKKRSELKRIKKSFTDKYYIETIRYPSDFPAGELKEISHHMHTHGVRSDDILNDELLDVAKKLYISEMLIVQLVKEGDCVVAANMIIVNKERALLWIDVYKSIKNINIYSYICFMESVCSGSQNFRIVDFGRGLYKYKLNNFLPQVAMQATLFFSKSQVGFIKYAATISLKTLLKEFYKKHKSTINKVLRR